MGLTYKELMLDIFLDGAIEVEAIQLRQEVNAHAVCSIKLLVEEDKIETMVEQATRKSIRIQEKKRTKGTTIFEGSIEVIYTKEEKGLFYLYIEAYSHTKQWDRVEKSRSFLNGDTTYLQVIESVLADYTSAEVRDKVTKGAKIPEMLLQYEESDWSFIKRLASHFGGYLFVDCASNHGRVYIGTPNLDYGMVLKKEDYILIKDMGHYKKNLVDKKILPQEASSFKIQTREYLYLGEEIHLNRIQAIVTSIDIHTSHGELVYQYILTRKEGIWCHKSKNPRIFGMSIPATVKERSGNRIRVHFDIDPVYDNSGKQKYFTYAIESSSIYCMPEEGSRVHIYFPDHDEQNAIAVHAIRETNSGNVIHTQRDSGTSSSGGNSGDKSPENKSFSTPNGNSMNLTPDTLSYNVGAALLSLNQSGNISLTGVDLTLKTQKGMMAGETPIQNIMLYAQNKVTIGLGEGEDDEIVLEQDVNIVSAFIKQEADEKPAAVPDAKEVAKQIKEQDEAKRDSINNDVANKLIETKLASREKLWNGLKSAALAVGVIAITVCTAGTGLPALMAASPILLRAAPKLVFSIGDISEGLSGYNNVANCDTTPPHNVVRDSVFRGNQAAYDMCSMGADILFDTISGTGIAKSASEVGKIGKFCGKMQKAMMGSKASTKIGIDVIGGMMDDYMRTGRVNPTGVAENILLGKFKNSVGNKISKKISKTVNTHIDTCKKRKLVSLGIHSVVDTGIDVGSELLHGRKVTATDISMMFTKNLIANKLSRNYGEPIDAVTGSFFINTTDFEFPDLQRLILLKRSYFSTNTKMGILGRGWTFVYEGCLIRVEEEQQLQVELNTGHHLLFEWTGKEFIQKTKGCDWFLLTKEDKRWKLVDRKEHCIYWYRLDGLLESIEDQNGQELRFYYQNNTLKKMVTALGYCVDFVFKDGLLVQMKDHIGRTIQYRYEQDLLVDVIHMDQGVTHYEYDTHGYLIKAIDQAGVAYLINEYDQKGRVISQRLANGDIYQAEYIEEQRQTRVYTNIGNKTTIFEYGTEQQVTSVLYQDGTREQYEYSKELYRTKEINRLGQAINWEYDTLGRLKKKIKPSGYEETYIYNEFDDLVQKESNIGQQIFYQYDEQHNVLIFKEKIESDQFLTTFYTYDRLGRLTSEVNKRGQKTTYHYREKEGKPAEIHYADGDIVTFVYDKVGRLMEQKDSIGIVEFGYNADNHRTLIRDGEGRESRYFYDGMGRLLAEYSPKAWKEQKGEISYKYDFLDRLVDTIHPDGSHERLFRDGEGNITKVIHPNAYESEKDDGKGLVYEYDFDYNRIRIHYPDGGCERFFYDAEGHRIKHILPEYYDKDTDNGLGYEYTYDQAGRLTTILDPNGEIESSYTYDMLDHITSKTDAFGKTTYYQYDIRGNLLTVLTPAKEREKARKETLQKDISALNEKYLIKKIESNYLYEKVSFIYNEHDRVTKEIRHSGLYDWKGNLVKQEEGEKELCISYTYDSRERVVCVKDNTGARLTLDYNSRGNLIYEEKIISDDVKQIIRYCYDKSDNLIEQREELDSGLPAREGEKKLAITKYFYDDNGNRTKIITPEGYQILREYDYRDRLIAERTLDKQHGIDRTIQITYDFASNITKIIQKGKETESFELLYDYDLKDRIVHIKDCLGAVYQYEYDKNDRTIKEVYPQAVIPSGRESLIADIFYQNSYHYLYDVKNNHIQTRDSEGHILEENVYRIDGSFLRQRMSNGNEISYTYGIRDSPTEIYTTSSKRHGKPAETLEYDSKGRIVGVKDGNQNVTKYRYDLWGNIEQIDTAEGGAEQYTYDYAGNITSSTDPNGNTILYRFNSQGKVCEVVDQEGNSDQFYYDREGRQILHINRNGEEIRTTYNVDGNPVMESGKNPVGKTVATRSWNYDSLGRISIAKSGNFVYSYEYQVDGKLRKKTSSGKTILACTYYVDGSLRTLTDAFGKTSHYFYDYKGNLSSIQDENGEELVQYRHTIDGRLKEIQYQNGIRTIYEYDTDGNISRLSTLTKENKILCNFQYDYDLNGNRIAKVGVNLALSSKQKNTSTVTTLELGEIKEHQGDDSNQELSLLNTRTYYQYDSMNRLLEEAYYENEVEETMQYEYDFCGNRLSKKQWRKQENFETIIQEEKAWYNKKNQLLKRQSEKETIFYMYDKQGNTIKEMGGQHDWTYTYNPFGQQIRIENTSGYFQDNFYDGEYIRVGIKKKDSYSQFSYLNGELLSEIKTKQQGQIGNRLVLGYGIVASEEFELQNFIQELTQNSIPSSIEYVKRTKGYGFYHLDEQNSTAYITGRNQEIQNFYAYDAFGNIRNKKETLQNRILYAGQQYDKESNQYYLRARYYNPIIGRFIQEDVYRGDGLNLYDYCKGNPVVWYDPNGDRKKKKEPVPFVSKYFNYDDINSINYNALARKYYGAPPEDMYDAHAHHIVFKIGRGKKQKKMAKELQMILVEYGIDPIKGKEVLCWAPNRVKGQHSTKTFQKLYNEILENEKKYGKYSKTYDATIGKEKLIEILDKHKKEAVERGDGNKKNKGNCKKKN